MCCQLVLLGLAKRKPSWSGQACSGQAQAELDGSICAVYQAPKGQLILKAVLSSFNKNMGRRWETPDRETDKVK